MKYFLTLASVLVLVQLSPAQAPSGYPNASTLKLEDIMRGEDFTGYAPVSPFWSLQSDSIYFYWQTPSDKRAELYAYELKTGLLGKVPQERKSVIISHPGYHVASPQAPYLVKENKGDICLLDRNNQYVKTLARTSERESQGMLHPDGTKVYYLQGLNYYSYDLVQGVVEQLTQIERGKKPEEKAPVQDHLFNAERELMMVMREERDRERWLDSVNRAESRAAAYTFPVYLNERQAIPLGIDPRGRFACYSVYTSQPNRQTEVPDYITENGQAQMLKARPKVGQYGNPQELLIVDLVKDSAYYVDLSQIPGIRDKPAFLRDYVPPGDTSYTDRYDTDRGVYFSRLLFDAKGNHAVLEIFSHDNKDRWIMQLDVANGSLRAIDRQRDEAWVAGPGVRTWGNPLFFGFIGDGAQLYYVSERTGYAHLYTHDLLTDSVRALTSGEYEVHDVHVNKDHTHFMVQCNMEHPGIYDYYVIPAGGGDMERVTNGKGRFDIQVSPDGKKLLALHSQSNQPVELYFKEGIRKGEWTRITQSVTPQFNDYSWRKPEFITFTAADSAKVHARLYRPRKNAGKGGPAVIFVHGAGYLQNAHQYWSTYYREYMFHNFLVDNGYTVLDIDYRGSAGYGRDWRTGIYRHMGGKDLSDHIDGARFLVDSLGIDQARIGIYGGSYGGFITLMALFQHPGTFAAGAALRSVTDWAHYNHGYTSNILNTPQEDSLAFRRSSPIYYAEGLKDPLLILHGMVDVNVQFQDVVRLSQRLIELRKENWELAVYPEEDHGFRHASSWLDEYRRIYLLFDRYLKRHKQ